jgi:glutamyl-tRNA synthetase
MDLCDFFFINRMKYSEKLFEHKKLTRWQIACILQAMIWHMDENENWKSDGVSLASRQIAEIFGIHHKKDVMPFLFASLMGKTQGPPLFDSAELLGKDITRARFLSAIEFLGGISGKKIQSLKSAWDKKDCKALFADLE